MRWYRSATSSSTASTAQKSIYMHGPCAAWAFSHFMSKVTNKHNNPHPTSDSHDVFLLKKWARKVPNAFLWMCSKLDSP
jgi:hypothetical protein